MVDEETLIKIDFTALAHMLLIVLIEETYISAQVSSVVYAMKALAWAQKTETVLGTAVSDAILGCSWSANALVRCWEVASCLLWVVFLVIVFQVCEALQACFSFHLRRKRAKGGIRNILFRRF